MTKPKKEVSKKHGDKLEPLIESTAGGSRVNAGRSPQENARRSAPEEDSAEDDPTLLQDDDDEDLQNDDVDDRRDVGERD